MSADVRRDRTAWALILGASSGFGEAAALELAGVGMNIVGVHLDRKSTMGNLDRIMGEIKAKGREALFFNVNAADPEKRREVLDAFAECYGEVGEVAPIRVLLHSLAFGTLKPFLADSEEEKLTKAQISGTKIHSATVGIHRMRSARPSGSRGMKLASWPAVLRAFRTICNTRIQ